MRNQVALNDTSDIRTYNSVKARPTIKFQESMPKTTEKRATKLRGVEPLAARATKPHGGADQAHFNQKDLTQTKSDTHDQAYQIDFQDGTFRPSDLVAKMAQNDGVARGTPKRIAVDTSHRKRRSTSRKSDREEALLLSNSRFGSNDSDGRSLDRRSSRSPRSSPGRPAGKVIRLAGLEDATAGRGDSPPSKSSHKRFKEENTPCFKRQMPSNS